MRTKLISIVITQLNIKKNICVNTKLTKKNYWFLLKESFGIYYYTVISAIFVHIKNTQYTHGTVKTILYTRVGNFMLMTIKMCYL